MTGSGPVTYARGVSSDADPHRPPRAALWRDAGFAAALGLVMVGGTYGAARHQVGVRPFGGGTVALLILIAAAVAWRRRYPVAVLGLVSAATLIYFVADYPPGPVWFGLLVAYATATVLGHRLAAGAAAVGGFLVFPWLGVLLGRGGSPSPLFLSTLAAGLLILFGAAEGVRVRRLRQAEAVRARQEAADRRASEERLRIARDLHDVLAHNISLISVQAGVALHVNEALPEQARSALTAIRGASGEALAELRSALDALRQTGDAAPRLPAPGAGQLDTLAARARLAGLDAALDVEGTPVPLPAPLDLAVYRIAQEALTNVIRHAGATAVSIALRYGHRDVVLRVQDDGGGAPRAPASGAGSGIAGMRERARALGGTLQAEPGPQGGFSVVARLPLDPDPAGAAGETLYGAGSGKGQQA